MERTFEQILTSLQDAQDELRAHLLGEYTLLAYDVAGSTIRKGEFDPKAVRYALSQRVNKVAEDLKVSQRGRVDVGTTIVEEMRSTLALEILVGLDDADTPVGKALAYATENGRQDALVQRGMQG